MAQHLVVSCFIMRMPESAISKLVREVGEKWRTCMTGSWLGRER